MTTPVTISITEFIEPRDRGEITISAGSSLIARKSNISLFGDSSVIVQFVSEKTEAIKPHLNNGLVFKNVDPIVQERIKRLLD